MWPFNLKYYKLVNLQESIETEYGETDGYDASYYNAVEVDRKRNNLEIKNNTITIPIGERNGMHISKSFFILGNNSLNDSLDWMTSKIKKMKPYDSIKVDASNLEKTLKKEASECYKSGFGQS